MPDLNYHEAERFFQDQRNTQLREHLEDFYNEEEEYIDKNIENDKKKDRLEAIAEDAYDEWYQMLREEERD